LQDILFHSQQLQSGNVERLYKIPLIFLFIASCIGLFLRYQQVNPVGGVTYSYILHAHSHVMFLGWLFNVFIIAFTAELAMVEWFKVIFWFLQWCVVGMLISFPLQGYGAFSITFSSLHTIAAFVFIVLFFRSTKGVASLPLTMARIALIFFALSSFGPFLLGYLKANGLEHSNMYRFSIYFYLHFQYNGFFFFSVLSLFIKLMENEMPVNSLRAVKIGSYIFVFACVPAYVLSILWSQPSIIFNIIGLISALAQLIGCLFLFRALRSFFSMSRFNGQEKLLFMFSFAALGLKFVLQLISAFPAAALFANEFRAIVIAYLHVVLVGFISLFLIAWLMQKRQIESNSPRAVGLIVTGFIGSEIFLAVSPWSESYLQLKATSFNFAILLFSVLMVTGIGLLLMSALKATSITASNAPASQKHQSSY
jgi:hypothetical protein